MGKTYHIEIELPNGKRYKSIPEKMPEAAALDSVSYEVVKEAFIDFEGVVTSKNFYKIYANSTFHSSKEFIRWFVDETFLISPIDTPGKYPSERCFVSQNADPQRIALFDASSLHNKSLKKFLVAKREVDWTFLEKHYFTTNQTTITKDAYIYWRNVNIVANQNGSIFDSPPAEVLGNIFNSVDNSDKALGYFQAVNQSYHRRDFYKYDLPFPLIVENCEWDPRKFAKYQYALRCVDCLWVRNSSKKRPSWF